jgi:hypothetical protein
LSSVPPWPLEFFATGKGAAGQDWADHGDITANCGERAWYSGRSDPRALLHEWVNTTSAETNEARLRMTHPQARISSWCWGAMGACGVRAHDAQKLARAKRAVQDMLQRVRRTNE